MTFSGEAGVTDVLNMLKEELELALRLCGCASLDDIRPEMVQHQVAYYGPRL